MVQLPDIAWIAIGLIILAAALAVLNTLGTAVRNELMVIDLRAKTARLRTQYRKRLAEAEDQEVIEVGEAEPEAARQAA